MSNLSWVILYVVLIALFAVLAVRLAHRKERRVRQAAEKQKIIPSEEFEADWIIDEKKQLGYKYEVFSGCYVIFIFDKPVRGGNYTNFDDIYIGQSVNVTRRVHGHLTGKGKGDVYADIKYGRYAYIELIPCDRDEMNELEKALIEVFHSTESYNDTQGGGQDRTSRWPHFFHKN